MGRPRALAVVAFTSAALAGPVPVGSTDDQGQELGIDFHTFQDSRNVSVQSPSFTLSRDFTDRTGLRASFGVDVISAASDSCVRCHSQGTGNQRVFLGAAVVRKITNATVSFGGEFSQERFYRSTTILTSASRSFNKSNTTVAGGFSVSLNRPKLHPRSVSESQTTENAFASVTQTLTKTTVAQVGYELGHIGGYQNDPFLRALVNDQLVLGNHPQDRRRQTFTLRLRQALPAETYLEADYRRYVDDWSVHSNAFSAGVSHQFTRQLLFYLGYRRYDQTGAYFFAPEYFGTPEFFTSDFRLEPFASDLFTGRAEYSPRGGLWFLPRGSRVSLQYDGYTSDTDFHAGILTLRLRIPWGRRPGSP